MNWPKLPAEGLEAMRGLGRVEALPSVLAFQAWNTGTGTQSGGGGGSGTEELLNGALNGAP